MEPAVSLLCSPEPATRLYHKPDKSARHTQVSPFCSQISRSFTWLGRVEILSLNICDIFRYFGILYLFRALSPSVKAPHGGTTTSDCAKLLQTVLHPQPEDRPCQGEMGLIEHGFHRFQWDLLSLNLKSIDY
jgi:hypothetical protein